MEKLDRVQNAQFWGLKTWGQGGSTPRGSSGSANAGRTNYSVPYKLVAFIGPFSTIVSYLK